MGRNSELVPPPNNNPPTVSIISKLWQFLFYFILQSLPSDRKNIQPLPFSSGIKTMPTSILSSSSLSFPFFPLLLLHPFHPSRASQKTYMYFPKNPSARYTWRNRAKGTSSMDERSACVKADPKRIREVFKRGERIKGISRSIEIRNRTRLARLLHAKIEGKQRRKGESRGRGREKWK